MRPDDFFIKLGLMAMYQCPANIKLMDALLETEQPYSRRFVRHGAKHEDLWITIYYDCETEYPQLDIVAGNTSVKQYIQGQLNGEPLVNRVTITGDLACSMEYILNTIQGMFRILTKEHGVNVIN